MSESTLSEVREVLIDELLLTAEETDWRDLVILLDLAA